MLRQTVLLLLAFSTLAFANVAAPPEYLCENDYESCITSCCADCNSTLVQNGDGSLACDVGTKMEPNTECMELCLPCSMQYNECLANIPPDTPNPCWCAPALIILAGLVFVVFSPKQ